MIGTTTGYRLSHNLFETRKQTSWGRGGIALFKRGGSRQPLFYQDLTVTTAIVHLQRLEPVSNILIWKDIDLFHNHRMVGHCFFARL